MAMESRSSPAKKHGRISSVEERRISVPRRSTKGPLDVDLKPDPALTHAARKDQSALSPRMATHSKHSASTTSVGFDGTDEIEQRNFAKLLRPEIFHPLSHLDQPLPFRAPHLQPASDTPLQSLLKSGHFRAAAILAAHQLTTATSPTDTARIFHLFYLRLTCLTIINLTLLAAQEAKALEDLNSIAYHDPHTNSHLIPWDLRVLAVRLQSIGFGDWRRGIMAYYEMAREARTEVIAAPVSKKGLWKDRLKDLGLRVGNALVEMGDLDGAVRHLDGLRGGVAGVDEDRTLRMRLCLLFLRIGDVSAARKCFVPEQELHRHADADVGYAEHRVLGALCTMADGKYDEAVLEWRRLSEANDLDHGSRREMVVQNLAVCLLYTGQLTEARHLLEGLVDDGRSIHGLTFNLSTIYELCTEKSRALKMQLAEKVVAQTPAHAGACWDRSNADFKL